MSDVHGFINLASVTSGFLFLYASIIFGEFYFGEHKKPRETRVIKFSLKLSILQYMLNLCKNLTLTIVFELKVEG